MTERTYLDWNASAPLRPQARATMIAALDELGNASSIHREGRASRRLVEQARERVAVLVGAEPRNVVFNSGGTEANMLALTPTLETSQERPPFDRLLVSAVEHVSVRCGGRFPASQVDEIAVTRDGVIDINALERRLRELEWQGDRPPLVSVMAANNETGAIQPVAEVAAMVHRGNGLLHVDAVQAVGRMVVNINDLAADFMSISAHKIGGPHGVGALIARTAPMRLGEAMMRGGGQERGLRAGTENVAGIAGFGAAAAAALAGLDVESERMSFLRDRLEAGLRDGPTEIFCREVARLPNTSLIAVPGLKAETALIALDLDGFAVSAGSACSSGKVTPSHVLAAMGVEDDLRTGAIRLSIGPSTSENEIDMFLEAWRRLISSLSKDKCGLAA
jgi:cysteine desulfurase